MCLPAGDKGRQGLPARCDRAWFSQTFCGGANLDVVVRSDPEVCGLSGDDFRLSLHHSGHGDCTVGSMSLVDCPNSLVVEEFLRWMQQAGRLQDNPLEATQD